MAGDWYLWFPWQPPSDWKEPESRDGSRWEGLCDSPIRRQETVNKQPPSEAMGWVGGGGGSVVFFLFIKLPRSWKGLLIPGK